MRSTPLATGTCLPGICTQRAYRLVPASFLRPGIAHEPDAPPDLDTSTKFQAATGLIVKLGSCLHPERFILKNH